jgi:hypothetical protein
MDTQDRILPKMETEHQLVEDPEGDIVPVDENEPLGPEPDDYEEEEESDDEDEDEEHKDEEQNDEDEDEVDLIDPDEDEEGREVIQVPLEPRIKIEDLPVVEIAPPEGNNEGEKGEKEGEKQEYEVEENE